ncbi:MAG: transcriptional regulator [Sphingomonadales bacterium BRH_c42]|nr:MAG: transcriptional regulator [Sphingomonadales bacterium BRH_c42]
MVSELAYRMSDNSRLLRRLFDERVRQHGLTAAQARLLLSLDLFPGENQAFYADRLEIEPITLTRIVDRMEDAGWLERRADPADRRARILHLTGKSRRIVETLRLTLDAMMEEVLAGMNVGERRMLETLNGRIGDNLARARGRELVDG